MSCEVKMFLDNATTLDPTGDDPYSRRTQETLMLWQKLTKEEMDVVRRRLFGSEWVAKAAECLPGPLIVGRP